MNNTQQQQAQQFVQQQAKQGAQMSAQKQPVSPSANDEVAQVAQLGYN
jgi:hypothetical protein